MMADLFDEEAVMFVGSNIFICFSQERIERFSDTANGRSVFASCKCCYVDHSFCRICTVSSDVEKICIFHVFCDSLEKRCWFIERDGKRHLGHVLSNHGFENALDEC
jgi:hypothetical protein